MEKLQELAWVAWIGQAGGIDHCSLSGHQGLRIPDPNHCPQAASLEGEEGGLTLVKCFVLLRSGPVRELGTSSCVVGLVACSCFVCGSNPLTGYPLLSKNEPRQDCRAVGPRSWEN